MTVHSAGSADAGDALLRVLIVEDSRFDAELLAEALNDARPGAQLTVVRDEAGFTQALSKTRFDVILSDFELPSFSGALALDLARQSVPDVPFIFVSGVIGEDNAVELLKRGATDYVSKNRLARLPVVLERALKEAAGLRTLGLAEHRLKAVDAAVRKAEARRLALSELSDRIRDLEDPSEMGRQAGQALALQLAVDRAGFAVLLDGAGTQLELGRESIARDLPPWNGALSLSGRGLDGEALLRGGTFAIADVREDARTQEMAAPLISHEVVSFLCAPVVEQQRCWGVLYVCHRESRTWPDDERDFVADVVDRLRSALVRHESRVALQSLAASLEQQVEERAAELEAAKEQLRQSQKLEAVGQLTGGLAHDFNNLLASISGALELLRRRAATQLTPDMARYIGTAQSAAQRAASLTHRLLAFARRQTLEPKTFSLNTLIREMEELVRRTIGPSIEFEIVPDPDLWNVHVDASQMENALLNLCINARDAMPEGGRIVVQTANRMVDARAAESADMSPGQYVAMLVKDTGTGMSAEVAERAFDPFYTTKPIGLGTGLGLSMVYGFAKQSGGRVSIQSQVNHGTTVCIELPRSQRLSDQPAETQAAPGAPQAGRGETVLVVDDEAPLRMLIVEVMQELGYETLEAGNGAEALQWLRSERRIDLLVTDVGLPGGMNGRQIADAARGERPEIKVLFVTGYAETALGPDIADARMHVMTKPFEMEALARRVKEIIRQ